MSILPTFKSFRSYTKLAMLAINYARKVNLSENVTYGCDLEWDVLFLWTTFIVTMEIVDRMLHNASEGNQSVPSYYQEVQSDFLGVPCLTWSR